MTEQKNENLSYELLIELFEQLKNSKIGKVITKINPMLLNELRDIVEILNKRPPRAILIGRRGSGKSSLINAILGKNKLKVGSVVATTDDCYWDLIETEDNKKIEILDTRGAGETFKPIEAKYKTPIESLEQAIKLKKTDLLIFVVKAKEVDANIENDIDFVKNTINIIQKEYKVENVPFLLVINQVDELDPVKKEIENDEKQKNINIAIDHMKNILYKKTNIKYSKIIPVCSYMYFNNNNELEDDHRWNINLLIENIAKELPTQAQLEFNKIANIKSIQTDMSNKIVNIFSAITGIVGSQPIPVADLPVLSSLQITMISMIAAVAGRKLEINTIKELLTSIGINLGSSFIIRELARAILKFWPGYGNMISGTVAGGTTKVYGKAAIKYFIEKKDQNQIKKYVDIEMKKIK